MNEYLQPHTARRAISRMVLVMVLVASPVVMSSVADAYECEEETPQPYLLLPLVNAPLNTRIWVAGGPASNWKVCSGNTCIALAVRKSKYRDTFELSPQSLLKPRTKYAVTALVESKRVTVGTFSTGTRVDRTAPTGKALTRLKPVDYGDQSDVGMRQGYRLEMEGSSRDAASDFLMGVWAAQGQPDYNRLPDAILRKSKDGTFTMDTGAICDTTHFPFLDLFIGQHWSDNTPRFVIGVRAIDRAGNLGPATQETVDFGHAVIESEGIEFACMLGGPDVEPTPKIVPGQFASLDSNVWVFLNTVIGFAPPPKLELWDADRDTKVNIRVTGNDVVMTLNPTSVLRPNTDYRILNNKREIGDFRTGTRRRAKRIRPAPKLQKPRVLRIGRALNEIVIQLQGGAAPLYEVRIVGDKKLIAKTIMQAPKGVLRIREELCIASDFSMSSLQRANTLVFRVRALNTSGRVGRWAEATLSASSYR
ncbi:MAG: hypothetical protein JKY56_02405 [Kofleriaceae bacterium]|nr:hypothetical protein [Kofleriaceae bacterium]